MGKLWGIDGNRRYSPYSPVKIWYDGIISANFQEWSGETCLNLMNFLSNEIRNRDVFVYLNPSSARDGHAILGSRSLRGTSGANKDSYG